MGLIQSSIAAVKGNVATPVPLVIDTTVKDESSLLTKPKNLSPITEEVVEQFKEPTVEDVKATIITTPNITSIIEPEVDTVTPVTDSTVTTTTAATVTTVATVNPVADNTTEGTKVEVAPVDVSPAADVVKKNKKKNKNKGHKH